MHESEPFGEALRQARLRKGLTQRELGQLAGIPQAHISNIENGAVNMRLSTLVQLARLLDLEPTLAPRSALSAVQAIVRGAEAESPARAVRMAVNDLYTAAERVRRDRPGDLPELLGSMASDIGALASNRLTPAIAADLTQLTREVERAAETGNYRDPRFRRAQRRLDDIRHSVSQAAAPATRPAYTLDDEA